MTKDEMMALADKTAAAFSLDPSLLKALIENESSWNPHAERYEGGFFQKYIVPLGLKDAQEAKDRATSFGLCQVLGETARELGFKESMALLFDPAVNIFLGAKKLRKCLDHEGGKVREGLLRYNGGADKAYPDRVLARQPKYWTQVAPHVEEQALAD